MTPRRGSRPPRDRAIDDVAAAYELPAGNRRDRERVAGLVTTQVLTVSYAVADVYEAAQIEAAQFLSRVGKAMQR